MMEFKVYTYEDMYGAMEETLKVETLEELKEKVRELSDEYYACAFVDFDMMEVYVGNRNWCGYQFTDYKSRAVYVSEVDSDNGMFKVCGVYGDLERVMKVSTLEELKKACHTLGDEYMDGVVVELESETMFVGDTEWALA